jgi:hypothetical protein
VVVGRELNGSELLSQLLSYCRAHALNISLRI